jgi:hypothetical protein
MKRVLIALVAVGFVVVAIGIARANSGDENEPKAKSSTSTANPEVKEQVQAQAEQVLKAQADLAEKVAEDKRANGRQSVVVTLREEVPGQVWIVGKIDGKPACVTPPKRDPTFIEVTAGKTGTAVASELAPLEASLLRSGACEASLEIFVPDVRQYRVTIGGDARDSFDPADLQNADHPLKVTIVG